MTNPDAFLAAGDGEQLPVKLLVPGPVQSGRSERAVERLAMRLLGFCEVPSTSKMIARSIANK